MGNVFGKEEETAAAEKKGDNNRLSASSKRGSKSERKSEALKPNKSGGFQDKGGVGVDDFELIRTVGKGSFAKVIQVRKKDTGKIYAMKVLMKEALVQRRQVEHTRTERNILEDIDHPFIVSLRFAFQSASKLYMVFDYFNGGELFNYLSKGRFSLERARLYAAEIVLALEHLHSLNIIYRDLKPENILLDADGHIRLTDFGLSKQNVTGEGASSFVGTPEYLPPEMIRRERYGKSMDWWCLGVLLYEMIGGLPPFYDTNVKRMYTNILEMEVRFPHGSTFPEAAQDLLLRLMDKDPTTRIRVADIKSHAFFAPLSWDKVASKTYVPPFQPRPRSDSDTGNISSTFTRIPPNLPPTPQGDKNAFDDPDLFPNFSFVHSSLLDVACKVRQEESDYPAQLATSPEMRALEAVEAVVMAEVLRNAAADGRPVDGAGSVPHKHHRDVPIGSLGALMADGLAHNGAAAASNAEARAGAGGSKGVCMRLSIDHSLYKGDDNSDYSNSNSGAGGQALAGADRRSFFATSPRAASGVEEEEDAEAMQPISRQVSSGYGVNMDMVAGMEM